MNLFGLQIDPLRTMIQVEPGRNYNGSVLLTNTEDRPVTITISLANRVLRNFQDNNDWLKLEQNHITIGSMQQAVLNYFVLAPEGATGELRSRIAFSEVPSELEQSMLSINTKISVPFFAAVKGTEEYNFEVTDFKLNDTTNQSASVTLHNGGNMHVRPTGTCLIRQIGQAYAVESVQLNKSQYPLFPDESKPFRINFDQVLSPGKYVAEIQLESVTHTTHSIRQVFEFEVI